MRDLIEKLRLVYKIPFGAQTPLPFMEAAAKALEAAMERERSDRIALRAAALAHDKLRDEVEALERISAKYLTDYNTCSHHLSIAAERAEKAEDRIAELEAGYAEAVSDIEDWSAYAGGYIQDKHDLKGCLEQHRSLLHPTSETPPVSATSENICQKRRDDEPS